MADEKDTTQEEFPIEPPKDKGSQAPGIPLMFQQNIAPAAVKQQHLVPHPCQKGDIYYGYDGINFKRIAIGLVGQVLTVVNGIPAWKYLLTTGAAASRPSAGTFAGQQYYATDTFAFSVWSGSVWKSTTLA